MSDEKAGKIFEKIPLIMADIGPIGKAQYNKSQGFKFRGIDDVYNNVQSVLAKHKVFTCSEIIGRSREAVTTKSGGRAYFCINQFVFRFYAEDGSYVSAYADGEAMDTGDKASNKCAAIAHKYALIQTFCIPTADLSDPDAESHELAANNNAKQQPVQQTSHRGPSEKQLKRLFAITKNAGMRQDEAKRLMKQMFGFESSEQLSSDQYTKLCDLIAKTPNRGQQSADTLTNQYGNF